MATIIKSLKDLTKIIEPRIQKALEMTQEEIWEIVQSHIDDYYGEYTPKKYNRTEFFKNKSLIKTNVINNGGNLSCTVEIDPNYLDYTYPIGQHVTGLDVVTWANQHSHGGLYDDDFGEFWNDALVEIGFEPGIIYMMKSNLRKCGIPIK